MQPDERRQRRLRRASASAAASTVAALVQLGVSLVAVPLALGYLGNERYGLWMTVASLTAMVAFADFGLGNGLVNAVATADGSDDTHRAAAAVSSAVFLLSGFAVVLALAFWLSYPFVRWEAVLNASRPDLSVEARAAVAVTLLCAMASLPLGVGQRVQIGYQEGFVNSAWAAAGIILGLAGLVAAIHYDASLPALVLAMTGGPVVALAVNSAVLFGYRRPALRPRWRLVSRPTLVRLLRTGSLFFVIQLAAVVGYQLPTIAIARLIEPAAVTAFVVPMKLFLVVPSLLGFFLTPLWPAYREALTRGDVRWVGRLVRKSVTISVALCLAWGVALVFYGPAILGWWVGPRVAAPAGLRIGLALWVVAAGVVGPLSMFLNGAGALRFQAMCASSMAAGSIAFSVALIPALGVAGAVYGMLIAQFACMVVPSAVYAPRLIRQRLLLASARGTPSESSRAAR